MGHTHRYKFSFEKKKKTGKESQYMVSHPELDSDPPIGSDRESGRDKVSRRSTPAERSEAPPVHPEPAATEESPPMRKEEERPGPMVITSSKNKT